MTVGLYASKVQAEVLAQVDMLKKIYRDYPEINLYWCMIDLVGSSNYRIFNGTEKGYYRGETFFNLVRVATRPYQEIKMIKEIGDAVLICCPNIRPIIESSVIILRATEQLAFVAGDESFPFDVRIGIDFGDAKQLNRTNEDYLSESIDRLSRIMSVRSETSKFLMGEKVHDLDNKILAEYRDILTISHPMPLRLEGEKALLQQVVYRELNVSGKAVSEFNDYFSPWKK